MRQERILELHRPTKALSDRDGDARAVEGGVIQTAFATITVWTPSI